MAHGRTARRTASSALATCVTVVVSMVLGVAPFAVGGVAAQVPIPTAVAATVVASTAAAPAGVAPMADADLPPATEVLATADPTRPRILMASDELGAVHERLEREPYRSMLRDLQHRADVAPPPNADDQADCVQTTHVGREFLKMRAAANLSFLYLIDRVWDPVTEAVVQPTPSQRAELGNRARDHLRWMCAESRVKVQLDRDISTSHELLSALVAFDNLVAADYPFGEHEDDVVANLLGLTAELYSHYNQPNSSNINILGASRFLVNNHRSKGAASIGVAAIVLHDLVDAPAGWMDPDAWIDFALDRVDLVQRFTYGPGDGAYGEGPHYWRFAALNVVPFARAWDRASSGTTVTTAAGVAVPSLWRHPQFQRTQRWLLDSTLPDGSLAPTDDNKVNERAHFGTIPPELPEAGAYAWRWVNAPVSHETEANIDMAPFSIVIHDDAVTVAPPEGSPTRFYVEGGVAMLRSGWDPDARLVMVQGQHGAAREFGRDRQDVGEMWSAAHDHPDPGSFLFHAYGERLLMDPGYMDYPWSQHRVMNKPSDHNMVVVGDLDGTQWPVDPLPPSIFDPDWGSEPGAPVPADGSAQISHTVDSDHLDGLAVTARYGPGDGALVQRRFLFLDDTYLVTADRVTSDEPRDYLWPVHGNGGGDDGVMDPLPELSPQERPPIGAPAIGARVFEASGGTFEATGVGAVWQRPGASISVGLAFDVGDPTMSHRHELYEKHRNSLGQYTALYAELTAADVQGLTVNYPTPAGHDPPLIERLEVDDTAVLRLTDADGDRRVLAVARRDAETPLILGPEMTGAAEVVVTGSVTVLDTRMDGTLRSLTAEDATALIYDDITYLEAPQPSAMSVRLDADRAEIVAPPGTAHVRVGGLPFVPEVVDGGCRLINAGGDTWVEVTRERRVTLRAEGAAGRPAADPGGFQRAEVGHSVTLDGTRSCTPHGSLADLSPTWSLESAPAGSRWSLEGAETWTPELVVDRAGPFRVRLTVRDGDGRTSRETEVLVAAGATDGDGMDNDLDGWWDGEDPDGDPDRPRAELPEPAEPAAPPGSVAAVAAATLAEVAWEPPADDGGAPVLEYVVRAVPQHAGGVGDDGPPITVPADETSAVLVGLDYGGTYRFEVAAVTPAGLGTPAETEPVALGFTDVGLTHPFLVDIVWAADDGVAEGFDDGTFRPAAPVTRQAAAAFLWRLAGEPQPAGSSGFVDVGAGHPFAVPIAWMAEAGVAEGFDDGTFRPAAPVTRQAMVAFLHRSGGD
jgi:hypothetical protein